MRTSLNRKAAQMMTVFGCLAATAHLASAQATSSSSGFGLGYTDVGAVLGLGGLGGASASFGGRFEHAVKALPDMGNGIIGIQAAFDYYSWSSAGFSWKYIPIGVTANYHFKLDEPKIDPFLGLGLGYQIITCSGSTITCGSTSGIYLIGRAGARYFFSPKMAAYADVGAGAALLNLGLMFKLK